MAFLFTSMSFSTFFHFYNITPNHKEHAPFFLLLFSTPFILWYFHHWFFFALDFSQMRMDVYFIAPQKNRPSLFGCPLIVPCTQETKKSQLYSSVWQQVSRFVSAPPPGEESMEDRLVNEGLDIFTLFTRDTRGTRGTLFSRCCAKGAAKHLKSCLHSRLKVDTKNF